MTHCRNPPTAMKQHRDIHPNNRQAENCMKHDIMNGSLPEVKGSDCALR